MLEHTQTPPRAPERVVVLGASGFVAGALIVHLERKGTPVRAIGRTEIDLTAQGAGDSLGEELRDGDALVFLSAVTPDKGRGTDAFLANVQMGAAVCAAIAVKPLRHVVYVSSDAVYPFTGGATSEESCAEPTDLYGAAHLAREIMVRDAAKCPVAILRPTMIYGAGDTHNSYGANRFRRMARKDGRIVLFGEGEETRDHMPIGDVVALIDLVLEHWSSGTLNLVSGRSVSFGDLARMVAAHFSPPVEIAALPRQVPITYRKFDAAAIARAFPQFRPTPLEVGLATAHAASD
jgi:UDP-glucose 4-epimerase